MSAPQVLPSGRTLAPRTMTPATTSPTTARRIACWGLFSRQERWGLSLRGCLIFVSASILVALVAGLNVYPFLAVTAREPADYLAVEGWVHDYAIRVAASEFSTGRYRRVFSTGGPVQGMGGYQNDYSTAASVGAGRLRNAGVPAALVQMVPSRTSARDRTFGSAVALRDWLRDQHITIRRLNVVTEDAHARRTRLLFQEAFGESVAIGIIAVPNPDYDAHHWWRYSEGVRSVLGESIAYLYAKFFFHLPAASAEEAVRPPNPSPT